MLPVKDPTSDMYILGRKGSGIMKEARENKDRDKSRAKFWELAGSKMGDLLGNLMINIRPITCPGDYI